MAWAVSPTSDGKTWASDNLAIMTKLGGYLKPIRASVCGVLPSPNWPVKKCTYSTSPGYGATCSLDGTREFVHVFKVPEGRTLDMLPTSEPFKSAHLLSNGHPVQMESGPKAFRLTLDAADRWDPLDTVIVLERDVAIKTSDSDDPRITYSGNWWTDARTGFPRRRYCRAAGDYAEITFTGTKFAWYVGVKGTGYGTATVLVDGKPVADVDTSSAERENNTLCYAGTVPAGKHTVKLLNKSGGHIEIQRFFFWEGGAAK
jgi:hypothetical protein